MKGVKRWKQSHWIDVTVDLRLIGHYRMYHGRDNHKVFTMDRLRKCNLNAFVRAHTQKTLSGVAKANRLRPHRF